jgi:hypothetical protein
MAHQALQLNTSLVRPLLSSASVATERAVDSGTLRFVRGSNGLRSKLSGRWISSYFAVRAQGGYFMRGPAGTLPVLLRRPPSTNSVVAKSLLAFGPKEAGAFAALHI